MNQPRRSNTVVYALFINAALLLAILVLLLTRGRAGFTAAALGDVPPQMPITGGNGVYVIPCQFHPSIWGCFLIDTERQTLCSYEYQAGEKALVLTSARNFRYDLDLKNWNTFPAWYDIQKAVEDAGKNDRQNESHLAPQPDVSPRDNP